MIVTETAKKASTANPNQEYLLDFAKLVRIVQITITEKKAEIHVQKMASIVENVCRDTPITFSPTIALLKDVPGSTLLYLKHHYLVPMKTTKS